MNLSVYVVIYIYTSQINSLYEFKKLLKIYSANFVIVFSFLDMVA